MRKTQHKTSRSRSRKTRRQIIRPRVPLFSIGLAVAVVAVAVSGYLLHKSSRLGAHAEVIAEWNVECGVDHYAQDDPIVFPGQPGKSHMHSFYGNKTTNASSTPASINAGASDCNYIPQYDHSAYWIPSLYANNADGTSTQDTSPDQSSVLYYRRPGGTAGPKVRAFPKGLVIVAGDSHATSPQSTDIIQWDCGGGNEYPGLITCPAGSTLVGEVIFPSCWDGVHLDSADHKSHMAYANATTGACPADHPVSLPQLFFDTRYDTPGGPNYVLSSGGIYSYHADFMEGWDSRLEQGLIDNCVNNAQVSCHTIQVWPNNDVTVNDGAFLFNLNNYAATPTPSATPAPTGTPTAAQGDVNGDGKVNVVDLSTLLTNWGKNTVSVDFNHDGTVNILDLSIMLAHWTG